MSEERKPDFDFFVDGTPAPGGSKTFFPVWKKDGTLVWTWKNNRQWPTIRVVDDAGEANKRWREVVAWQARASLPRGHKPLEGALECRFNFWMRRPQNQLTTKGAPSSNWRPYPTVKPDVLKLARSTEDALTGILWADDAIVVCQINTKQYCGPGDRTGCRIRVTVL